MKNPHGEVKYLIKKNFSQQSKGNKLKTTVINKTIFMVLLLCE